MAMFHNFTHTVSRRWKNFATSRKTSGDFRILTMKFLSRMPFSGLAESAQIEKLNNFRNKAALILESTMLCLPVVLHVGAVTTEN